MAGGRQQAGWNASIVHPEYIYEARKGEKARPIAELDVARRRTLEAEITDRTVEFIRRNTNPGQAVLRLRSVFIDSYSDTAKSGIRRQTDNGDWADAWPRWTAPGQILDAIKQAGVEDNTLVVFTKTTVQRGNLPWDGDSGYFGRRLIMWNTP